MIQSRQRSSKDFHRHGTARVVITVLFCVGAVLFFQHVPVAFRWPVRLLWLGSMLWLIFAALRSVKAMTFNARNLLFSLILGSLFYAALHIVCHVFIRLMAPRDDRLSTRIITSLTEPQRMGIAAMLDGTGHEIYDRDIGWVPRPGHKEDDTQISRQGLRSLREYAVPPPDPEKRILCLGDSFTFGNGISDTDTYPYHAEKIRPGTEWINLGIPGACLVQSLLHYRKTGRRFGGKYVVIGFMTDDAIRTVNCFRPFLNRYNPFTKPFAKYSNGVFSLEPNPYQDMADYGRLLANEPREIERLLEMDYLTWSEQTATSNPVLRTAQYVCEAMHLDRNINGLFDRQTKDFFVKRKWSVDPYGRAIWNPDSLGFIALTRAFDLYHSEIIADGRVPLIVIIPGPFDVENHTKQLPRRHESLIAHLKAKQYRYFDFLDPLATMHQDDLSTDALFVARHFRGPINKELASEVIKALHLP